MPRYNIYPKQFRTARIPIEKNRCFVIMPFSEELEIVYGTIKQALQQNNYICLRADEISGSMAIITDVLGEIAKSHFVIADLTGKNANVFYELGVAHSFKDAHHIILISQSIEDVPFDIKHLRTIVYSKDNLILLKQQILNFLNENKIHYVFHESLQKHGIINVIGDNVNEFIVYIHDKLGPGIADFSTVLDGDIKQFSEQDVTDMLKVLVGFIYDAVQDNEHEFVPGIIRLIGVFIECCANFDSTCRFVYEFLNGDILDERSFQHQDIVRHQTDIAVRLATRRVCMELCLSWIVQYLKQSKSATIDLNRYKIERFLMMSQEDAVNKAILDAVFSDNNYIREHMADITGEKLIDGGEGVLLRQLQSEENVYTSASIISALGKYKNSKNTDIIIEWFNSRESEIVRTKHFFLIRHVYRALLRIGDQKSDPLIAHIKNNYMEHVVNVSLV